jgi:hypothetical protein
MKKQECQCDELRIAVEKLQQQAIQESCPHLSISVKIYNDGVVGMYAKCNDCGKSLSITGDVGQRFKRKGNKIYQQFIKGTQR